MKIKLEFEQEVTNYYKWLEQKVNGLKQLSVYSINGYCFLDDVILYETASCRNFFDD